MCSETDFTSKSEDFQQAAAFLAEAMLAADAAAEGEEQIRQLSYDGKTVDHVINEVMSKTGEKITLGDCVWYDRKRPGVLYSYVHFNNKLGTLVDIELDKEDAAQHEAIQTLAADLAMHVTATNPMAVTRDEIDPGLVAREREIAAEQVKGKPAEIMEKIVLGKLGKWYQEIVLLEQPFVKDDKKTVTDLVKECSGKLGENVVVRRFVRYELGA